MNSLVVGLLICGGLLTQIEYTKSWILLGAVAVALFNWLTVRRRGVEAPSSKH